MASRLLAGFLSGALLVALAQGQSISVPGTINTGEDISIGYEDASRAGQTIVVTVRLCDPKLVVIELTIHLDQRGKGSVGWTVPDGLSVTFNAPGAKEVLRWL